MSEPAASRSVPLSVQGVLIIEQGGRGGVADYTGRLAEALAARGLPVTIATASDHRFHPSPGVTVTPVFTYLRDTSPIGRRIRRAGLGRVANGLLFLAALPRLFAIARRHAVVHVQGWERTSLGVIAMLGLRLTGARMVYTAHNTFKRRALTLDSARLLPLLARATIVHTEADRARIGHDVSVIPHGHYGALADGAPEIEPAVARRRLGLPDTALVVMLFGVLRPDKGLGDLLQAVAGRPQWHLLVAGEEHGALTAAADALTDPRLSGRITVREGFLSDAEVSCCFAACDVVALPYRQASQSGVLHLAYGYSRPVIAYPVGGLVEALAHGDSGWLSAEASPDALADALDTAAAAGREELRARGRRARTWSQERFDWNAIAASTEAVYEGALGTVGEGIRGHVAV